ncbi:hypothetical protein ERO13_A12G037650v2 [Gossypium hirsutum]|nr:hypothetical protein ERO13_A12G037650v2 [Gossypium hirsutum]
METRSRKRAEASSAAPSSSPSGPTTRSHKRVRLSSSSAATAATVAVTRSRTSRTSRTSAALMDPSTIESSSGSRRDRRSSKANQTTTSDNPNLASDRGKEKEHDPRIRDRDRDRDNRDNNNSNHPERNLGLNMDTSGGDEDDNDSEGGVGILHQNLTSASSALQGLLRKLGAGLDDLLPSSAMGSGSSSHQSGRLKKVLSGLRADGEEGRQVEALTQLCEMLSIGTEESLSTFSVDSFVPVLVGLLNHESNPDIMILAARALTHLCDVLPSSCAAVVHYGAVSCFCARLLTIEYMDLAEQVGILVTS